MQTYFVYMLASKPYGTLYIGVTNNIIGRVEQHHAGEGSAFTRKHRVHRLVWYEQYSNIREAIQREDDEGMAEPGRRTSSSTTTRTGWISIPRWPVCGQ